MILAGSGVLGSSWNSIGREPDARKQQLSTNAQDDSLARRSVWGIEVSSALLSLLPRNVSWHFCHRNTPRRTNVLLRLFCSRIHPTILSVYLTLVYFSFSEIYLLRNRSLDFNTLTTPITRKSQSPRVPVISSWRWEVPDSFFKASKSCSRKYQCSYTSGVHPRSILELDVHWRFCRCAQVCLGRSGPWRRAWTGLSWREWESLDKDRTTCDRQCMNRQVLQLPVCPSTGLWRKWTKIFTTPV